MKCPNRGSDEILWRAEENGSSFSTPTRYWDPFVIAVAWPLLLFLYPMKLVLGLGKSSQKDVRYCSQCGNILNTDNLRRKERNPKLWLGVWFVLAAVITFILVIVFELDFVAFHAIFWGLFGGPIVIGLMAYYIRGTFFD